MSRASHMTPWAASSPMWHANAPFIRMFSLLNSCRTRVHHELGLSRLRSVNDPSLHPRFRCCCTRPTVAMSQKQLPRREIGHTGIQASVLSFGASPLGSVFEDIDEEEGVRAVHEAFRLGINYFDTSPFYGSTRSEQVLGRALKDLPRDQIVVATKVGRYGPEEFDFSRKRVTASVSESLHRLQVEYIDVIQTHDIEFGDLDQVVNEAIPALVELRQKGVVRHIGITGLPLNVFRKVLSRVPAGSVDLILSYCHHSLNDKSLRDLLPLLRDKAVGVVNGSVLSMGLLTNKGPPDWHPAPQEVKDAAARAAEHCRDAGVDIAKLAIMDAVRAEDVPTNLVGCASREQVRFNVQAALEGLGLAPSDSRQTEEEALQGVRDILQPIMNTTWPSGRPENN